MNKHDVKIVLVGPPGCGKSTLAMEAYKSGVPIVSTGSVLRKSYPQHMGEVNNGCLVPDRVVNEILIDRSPQRGPVLFEGVPRTLSQSVFLRKNILPHSTLVGVILDIPESEARERLHVRRRNKRRQDDDPQIVERRFMLYNTFIGGIEKHMMHAYHRVYRISAGKPKKAVAENFANILQAELTPRLSLV